MKRPQSVFDPNNWNKMKTTLQPQRHAHQHITLSGGPISPRARTTNSDNKRTLI